MKSARIQRYDYIYNIFQRKFSVNFNCQFTTYLKKLQGTFSCKINSSDCTSRMYKQHVFYAYYKIYSYCGSFITRALYEKWCNKLNMRHSDIFNTKIFIRLYGTSRMHQNVQRDVFWNIKNSQYKIIFIFWDSCDNLILWATLNYGADQDI